MTTTTGKTAAATAADGSAKPTLSGMARVREVDTWRLASIMHDAASEAERLCNDIYTAVSTAYFDHNAAAETAASDDLRAKGAEARLCLYAAVNYLTALIDGQGDPPF